MRTRTPRSFIAVLALGLALGGAACGSDDDDSATAPAEDGAAADAGTEAGAGDAADAEASEGEAGGSGDLPEAILGEEDAADLDAAFDAVGYETIMETVGDQLGASSVEVDGDDARIVLDDKTLDDAMMDCIVAGSFVDEGQTVTMVYPDGEELCD
jgi:hypothetical protein